MDSPYFTMDENGLGKQDLELSLNFNLQFEDLKSDGVMRMVGADLSYL